MYQSLHEWLLKLQPGFINNKIYRIGMSSLKVMTFFYNPNIDYHLGNVKMLFPASHATPFTWKSDSDYSMSLGRVAKTVTQKYENSVIVDVGANVGDSAAIIRANGVSNQIISIEGVKSFYKVLKQNALLLGEIEPINCFIGSDKLHAPNAKVRVLPTGNAVVYEKPDDYIKENKQTPIGDVDFLTLEEVVGATTNKSVKLLKTDIEGYDLPVLLSSINFISRNKPVIFMELHISGIDEKSKGVCWKDLWEELINEGYCKALYWRNSSDFLCSVDMESTVTEDLHSYFRNRWGNLYADVCLLHFDDMDLAEKMRLDELATADGLRPNESSPL